MEKNTTVATLQIKTHISDCNASLYCFIHLFYPPLMVLPFFVQLFLSCNYLEMSFGFSIYIHMYNIPVCCWLSKKYSRVNQLIAKSTSLSGYTIQEIKHSNISMLCGVSFFFDEYILQSQRHIKMFSLECKVGKKTHSEFHMCNTCHIFSTLTFFIVQKEWKFLLLHVW